MKSNPNLLQISETPEKLTALCHFMGGWTLAQFNPDTLIILASSSTNACFHKEIEWKRADSYLGVFVSWLVLVIYSLIFSSSASSSVSPSLLEGLAFKPTVVIPPRYDPTVVESWDSDGAQLNFLVHDIINCPLWEKIFYMYPHHH